MIALDAVAGLPLAWRQPKAFVRWYELRAGDALVATLGFRSSIGQAAAASSAVGAWTFDQKGVLDDRVVAWRTDSADRAALFTPRWTGDGTVVLADGRQLAWQSTSLWGYDWRLVDDLGRQLVAFRGGVAGASWRDIFKTQATLQLEPSGWTTADLTLLITFGWYLILWRQQRTAAVTTATSAAVF